MPQFDISTYSSQLFWLIVVFGILYLIVKKFVVPYAESIIKNRASLIDGNINEAEQISSKIEVLRSSYDKRVKEILLEAEEVQKEALNQLEHILEGKKKTMLQKLASQVEKEDEGIAKAKIDFQKSIAEESLDAAVALIEKITGQPVNKKNNH